MTLRDTNATAIGQLTAEERERALLYVAQVLCTCYTSGAYDERVLIGEVVRLCMESPNTWAWAIRRVVEERERKEGRG